MDSTPTADDLVKHWHAQRQQGRTLTLEELCAGSPERTEGLRQHLQAVAAMESFLGLSTGAKPRPSDTPADGEAGEGRVGAGHASLPRGVPGYEVLAELGRGGMGVVYRARQVKLDRLVALKMILAGEYAGPAERQRFLAEAEAVARLQHPGIVQIFEVGEHEGHPFFSLELCPGGSLAAKLAGTPLPPPEAARLVEALARAVQAAHAAGVVHRDLKPANVLLAADGTPKVTDFGLAKKLDQAGQTATGAILGTPDYMAPEQAAGKGKDVGPAADVYALGVILYELLIGRPPFKAATTMDTILQVLHDEPVPPRRLQPKVPRDLETVCLKCLHKEPHRRYASAEALADDLRRFRDGRPIAARPVGRAERLHRWCRRNPVVAGLAAALLGVVVAGFAVVVHLWMRAESQRRQAETNFARAEQSQRDARAAVDRYFTHVSQNVLLKQGTLQGLRKDLLQTAREFYQKFVDERRNDPAARADLAKTLLQLAQITEQIDSRERAIDLYQQAAQVYEQLAAQQPGEVEYKQDLAACLDGLALLAQADRRKDQAAQAHRRALEVLEELARDHPDQPGRQWTLAKGYLNLGLFHRTQQENPAAEANYTKSLALLEPLCRERPEAATYRGTLALALTDLGVLYGDTGRKDQADAALRRAIDLQSKLAQEHPQDEQWRIALADSHLDRGVVHVRSGRLAEAEEDYQQALRLYEAVGQNNPAVVGYVRRWASGWTNLANLYGKQGRQDKEERAHQQAVALWEKLARENPFSPDYQDLLAQAYSNQSNYYQARSRLDKAEEAGQRALAIREKLVRDFPETVDYQLYLGISYFGRGDRAREGGKAEEALGWFERALPLAQAVLKREGRLNDGRALLRGISISRALALQQLGRDADALPDWDRALEFDPGPLRTLVRLGRAASLTKVGKYAVAVREAEALAEEPKPSSYVLYNLALVYSLSAHAAAGDPDLALAERDRRREEYAARAVILLRRAAAAGHFQTSAAVAGLRQAPGFVPLRRREDFKKLLGELEEPARTPSK